MTKKGVVCLCGLFLLDPRLRGDDRRVSAGKQGGGVLRGGAHGDEFFCGGGVDADGAVKIGLGGAAL